MLVARTGLRNSMRVHFSPSGDTTWQPLEGAARAGQVGPTLGPDSEISIDDLNDVIAEAQQVVHDVLGVDASFVLRLVQAI